MMGQITRFGIRHCRRSFNGKRAISHYPFSIDRKLKMPNAESRNPLSSLILDQIKPVPDP